MVSFKKYIPNDPFFIHVIITAIIGLLIAFHLSKPFPKKSLDEMYKDGRQPSKTELLIRGLLNR